MFAHKPGELVFLPGRAPNAKELVNKGIRSYDTVKEAEASS